MFARQVMNLELLLVVHVVVVSKYGCRLQGTTDVAFTVLDVLGYLDEIPVCVAYDIDGQIVTDFPASIPDLNKAKPVLQKFAGWKQAITSCTSYEQLPKNAKEYPSFFIIS